MSWLGSLSVVHCRIHSWHTECRV